MTQEREQELYAVHVTDAERKAVRAALESRVDSLEKERKRLKKVQVATADVDEALAVVKGEGVSGGLLNRFAPRHTQDMFAREPAGKVRQLQEPEEGEPAVKQPPVDEAWGPLGELMEELRQVLETQADRKVRILLEDSEGEVWRVSADVQVGLTHVGSRPAEQVERAVEAAEEDDAPEGEPQKGGDAALEQLRRLAVTCIEDCSWITEEECLLAQQYATEAEKEWLQRWTRLEEGEPTPEVPEEWQPAAMAQELELEDLDMTGTARELAQELEVPAQELAGAGSGQNGRILKGDVEDAHNRLLSAEARAEAEG